MKFLYLMKDPMGADACKIGITSVNKSKIRLGVYQNSYSSESHMATFNYLWYGKNSPVSQLEATLKNLFGYAIMMEGRGFSEWISEPADVILKQIQQTIDDDHFHVYEAGTEHNIYTLDDVINQLTIQGSGAIIV
jgi:hypothetical protein